MTSTNSLETPVNATCAFCAYLEGLRPYTIARRNDLIAVLVTREQRGIPHLLVLPVRHKETILDLNDEEAAALMVGIRQTAFAINKTYRRPGIAVWQNNGVPANQAIGHVHFHVAGTLDKGGTEWGDVEEASLKETNLIADRLSPYLII
ncbi:MAG TPA: HIT domain-containing protein [Trebonia sp.]|jgi:histidine triad (HIT) family protein|nr:HIT domain-containing protein [Trebonia sp.]